MAAGALEAAGWRIVGRNVRVGRLEIDLLAVDPGPPARLVCVEVRSRGRRDFGLPEETVDRRKIARLRSALGRLIADDVPVGGHRLPRLPPAIDVVAVEPRGGERRVRLIRNVDG